MKSADEMRNSESHHYYQPSPNYRDNWHNRGDVEAMTVKEQNDQGDTKNGNACIHKTGQTTHPFFQAQLQRPLAFLT